VQLPEGSICLAILRKQERKIARTEGEGIEGRDKRRKTKEKE
jgi:hypothetical protein